MMPSSDHSQFQFAAERYVLDELPEQEKLAFEDHFFTCAACAQDVEDLLNIRDQSVIALPELDRHKVREKRPWFSQLWIPQFAVGALAVLAIFTAYQNAVVIPHLKAEGHSPLEILSAPQTVSSTRAASALTFNMADRPDPLVIATDWPVSYDRYRATVSRHSAADLLWSDEAPAKNNELAIALRPNRLGPGSYDLKIFGIRNGTDTQLVTRSFSIQSSSTQEKDGR